MIPFFRFLTYILVLGPELLHVQGEDYLLVLQMEIIKLLIFGEEYQKKLIISFQHH